MTNNLLVEQGKVFDIIGVPDAVIAQMDAQYMKRTVSVDGFDAVHTGKMAYVHARTKVEKKGLELRKVAKASIEDYLTAEQKEEKRILALLKPGEDRLAEEEKAHLDALEAIKQEKIKQEEIRIQARRDRLAAISVGFNGQVWTDGKTSLPEPLLKAANDSQFEEYYFKFHEAAEAEKKRLEVERIAKEEEAARIAKVAAGQEAERKRLEAITQEIEAERRRKETQDRLEQAEREKQEAELLATQGALAADKAEWERIKQAGLAAIEAAKQKAIDDELRAVELEKAKQEATEKGRKDAEEKIQRETEEATGKARLAKIAADRKEARRPDKERLLAFAKTEYFMPECKTDEGRTIIYVFKTGLDILVGELKKKAGEL